MSAAAIRRLAARLLAEDIESLAASIAQFHDGPTLAASVGVIEARLASSAERDTEWLSGGLAPIKAAAARITASAAAINDEGRQRRLSELAEKDDRSGRDVGDVGDEPDDERARRIERSVLCALLQRAQPLVDALEHGCELAHRFLERAAELVVPHRSDATSRPRVGAPDC